MDIIKAFDLLIKQEGYGGYAVKGDSGGYTKYGLAQRWFPEIDIKTVTLEQARQIYIDNYWVPSRCSELKPELIYIHFSCAVNCGVGSAIRILQKAARVNPDGVFGPATKGAAESISIQDYAIEWANHYRAIEEDNPIDMEFAKGWQNRIDTILTWFKQGIL